MYRQAMLLRVLVVIRPLSCLVRAPTFRDMPFRLSEGDFFLLLSSSNTSAVYCSWTLQTAKPDQSLKIVLDNENVFDASHGTLRALQGTTELLILYASCTFS